MDYKNGKIYCIRNTVDDDIYTGSTTQPLSKRMVGHRSDMKSERRRHYILYQKMNELGIENFYIELIEEFPCENKEQLTAKEGEYIRKMATLNHRIQGRTYQEWLDDTKEVRKEKSKEYRERIHNTILERKAKYREENRDKIREADKEWRENNKEKVKQRNRIMVNCECGDYITKINLKRHIKSKKHQEVLNNLNNINNVSLQTDNIPADGEAEEREEV